jgi:PIN domain
MKIFIDTNILLSFYHLTGDDLEELNKLVVLLQQKQIVMLLPSQTVDEFFRNREAKIADAIKRLREQRLNLQFPAMCKDYAEYAHMRDLQRQFEAHHAAMIQQIMSDVESRNLKADKLIDQLFRLAQRIETSAEILGAAKTRMDLGNPPGKNRSYGDAVNWESILEACVDFDDLYFVSDDKDYCSPLNENRFNEFLVKEWESKLTGDVKFYKTLSGFFRGNFPQIAMAAELEKELLIEKLAKSGSFATTHSVVAKLADYADFTASQANDIVRAAVSNGQVSWIVTDDDVHQFLSRIVAAHEPRIDAENLELLKAGLKRKDEQDGLLDLE